MRALILILGLITTALCITGLTTQARAQLNPGDILIIDPDVGTDSLGALFSVDPVTGNRTVISDFGDATQGTLGFDPFGVVLGASGDILVIDASAGTNFRGALFNVDTITGNRTVISDFGNASQGTLGLEPVGVALGASGDILVIDTVAGINSRGTLFSVDPVTGNRTVISDFGNASQGTLGARPVGVALGPFGNILVIDDNAGTNFRGALFNVNPITGNRTVISDFGDASKGALGSRPQGVALGFSGDILVADADAGTDSNGTLFSVDPITGNRTVISDFGNDSQGKLGESPNGVALGPSGDILVTDRDAGTNAGALFSVDPITGNRIVISDFSNASQGTTGSAPFGIAMVPPMPNPGDILVIDGNTWAGGRGALFSVNPFDGTRKVISSFGIFPLGGEPEDIAVGANGHTLVVDSDAGADGRGALFSIDPFTGIRTILSDFGDPSQGQQGIDPLGVALGASGNILVADRHAGINNRGALFSINPSNGNRTLICDFGDNSQGELGVDPIRVVLGASGNLLVIDANAGTDSRGALFSVDPSNGNRTLISDFGDASQGELGVDPFGVALGASGQILVIDANAGTDSRGALFSVDPSNGNRTLISDFGDGSQGELGDAPFGVALGASGEILVADPNAGEDSRGALFIINSSSGNRVVLSDFGDTLQGPLGDSPTGVALTVICGGKLATRVGTLLADNITGTAGPDVINLLAGNDTASGGDGNDLICGGTGNDTMNGGNGRDRLLGQKGRDNLNGEAGNDRLNGGPGNDSMNGGLGNDNCIGGPGNNDTAFGCETTTGVP